MLFYEKHNITSEHSLQSKEWDQLAAVNWGSSLFWRTWHFFRHSVRGPALRLDVGKHRVAPFNNLQFLYLLGRDLVRCFEAPPAVEQRAELFQMRVEALLRVVARVLGGDQELPVRRFQQQQLAADLLGQPGRDFMSAPQAAVGHLLHGKLGRIDVLPRPGRVLVEPHAVVALSAPGAFRQSNVCRGLVFIEILGAGDQLDFALRPRVFQRHVLQPLRPFKPPVPEQLGIKGRRQNGRSRSVAAIAGKRVCRYAGEVGGVLAGPRKRYLRIVRLLQSKIDLVPGDFPVAIAARPALLVKFQITCVARITVIAAPHLDSGARIARKERDLRLGIGARRVVRPVKVLLRTLGSNFHRNRHVAGKPLIRSELRRAVHQVGVDLEKFESMLRQELFHAFTLHGMFSMRRTKAVQRHGKLPWSRRTIAALRQPNTAWPPAKKALVRLHSGFDLRADRSVSSQQRKIAVRGAASDDLDGAAVIKTLKAANDVGAKIVKMAQRAFVEALPEARDLHHVALALQAEVFRVLVRGFNLAQQIFGEFVLKNRMRELLQQNRREIYVRLERQPLLLQFGENPQQWQVGLRRGFVQPLHAVRPGAVIHYVWKVRMQRKRHVAGRIFCRNSGSHWTFNLPDGQLSIGGSLLVDAAMDEQISSLLHNRGAGVAPNERPQSSRKGRVIALRCFARLCGEFLAA